MRSQLRRVAAAAAALGVVATVGAGTAAADEGQGSSHDVPLSSRLKTCNFVDIRNLPSATTGTGNAVISRSGNTVTAQVNLTTAIPDIFYGVRLIQSPRSSLGCGPSDPGVAMGRLYTNSAGIGSTTVSAPVMPGATGAWVSVEGPLGVGSQISGDFRTSDYIAKF